MGFIARPFLLEQSVWLLRRSAAEADLAGHLALKADSVLSEGPGDEKIAGRVGETSGAAGNSAVIAVAVSSLAMSNLNRSVFILVLSLFLMSGSGDALFVSCLQPSYAPRRGKTRQGKFNSLS